ncbi:SurA N-terminal domain-containing protein [[Pseudomonas] carboxydohydrogena]|uniref:SurA N-terminal domain-containing protein n=2 Tax=Afipia carboxydohydrogena TaxID=290 RepID=A0ABY8BK31_AFICR|nr:SurA N-terminal domain-containing protein [[Pseudomonas] carboxydohydrogena]
MVDCTSTVQPDRGETDSNVMMKATFLSVFASRLALSLATLLTLLAATPHARAQAVVVMVNGEPITTYDIEQRSRLITLTTRKTAPRQEVIQQLIDDRLKIKEAKKFGINLSASDVDGAFAGMGQRMGMSADQLAKVLTAQGVRPETMKLRLQADTAWGALVRGRYKQSLMVGERDVRAASGDATSPEQTESYEYQLRPVVIFVPRGSSPGVVEQRKKEAEIIRDRVQSCAEAATTFKSLRQASIRDTIVKTSADLPSNLRELLDKTPVGKMTPPEVTKQGIEMVALCDRKVTAADTPAKRAARDKLFAQKYEAKSKSYLDDLRKGAMIEYKQK